MNGPSEKSILSIILVRHGETEWNRIMRFQGQSDVELNEIGRAQAEALASTLKEEPLKAIYSSPLVRALETARTINRYHRISLEQRDGLMEMDLGDFEGLKARDLAKDQPDFLKAWLRDPASVRMPNGETLREVQERAWAVVDEISETLTEGSVLLCGHNFVNLTILCRILGLELSHFRRIRQNPGARSVIERSLGQYCLICLNDTCHLKVIKRPS